MPASSPAGTPALAGTSSSAAAGGALAWGGLPVGADVWGTLLVPDARSLLGALAELAASLSPRPLSTENLPILLGEQVGVPQTLVATLDLSRPLAVALLDPVRHARRGALPLVLALSVRSADQFLGALSALRPHQATLPSGVSRFSDDADPPLFVRVGPVDASGGGLAFVAWEEGALAESVGLLGTLVAPAAPAPPGGPLPAVPSLVLRLALENLYASYGPILDAHLARMAALLSPQGGPDPTASYVLRSLETFARLLPSARELEIDLSVGAAAVTASARLTARPAGALAAYVAAQRPGPAVGLDLLPASSALVYATHRDVASGHEDAEALAAYMAALARAPEGGDGGPEGRTGARALQPVLDRVLGHAGRDYAWALWPAGNGGVGMGGVVAVDDTTATRAALFDGYARLRDAFDLVVASALSLPAAPGSVRLALRPAADRLGGVVVDEVAARVRWGAPAPGAGQPVARALFGAEPAVDVAFVRPYLLFAFGSDRRARLAEMIASARGGAPASGAWVRSSVGPLAGALRFREGGRVTVSALQVARMGRLLAQAVPAVAGAAGGPSEGAAGGRRSRSAPPARLGPFLAAGDAVVVAATNVQAAGVGGAAEGSYSIAVSIPRAVLVDLGGLGGAFLRMALAPIVVPPAIPPLPAPPPAVMPPADPSDLGIRRRPPPLPPGTPQGVHI